MRRRIAPIQAQVALNKQQIEIEGKLCAEATVVSHTIVEFFMIYPTLYRSLYDGTIETFFSY